MARKKAAKKKKKKKRTARPRTNITVHIKLLAPKALRKELLSIAIAMIEMIKRYRAYVEMKRRKQLLTRELRKKVGELKQLRDTLYLQELPLSQNQVETMSQASGEGDAIEEVEEGLEEEMKLEKEESQLKRGLLEKKSMPQPRKEVVEVKPKKEKKHKDKLQADLDALRDKLSTI